MFLHICLRLLYCVEHARGTLPGYWRRFDYFYVRDQAEKVETQSNESSNSRNAQMLNNLGYQIYKNEKLASLFAKANLPHRVLDDRVGKLD